MTIILNTMESPEVAEKLKARLSEKEEVEVFHTTSMTISHCRGCNHCFLKNPGICSIKDDYAQILPKLARADGFWLVSDTHFGFVDAKGKKVMDRVLPLLNMGLEFREGIMRHTLRYGKKNFGLIYAGNGNKPLLEFWTERVVGNLGGKSLGTITTDKVEEVKPCM